MKVELGKQPGLSGKGSNGQMPRRVAERWSMNFRVGMHAARIAHTPSLRPRSPSSPDTVCRMLEPPAGQNALRSRGTARGTRPVGGLLAGMRIRKKLIVLHTAFSLVLAGILWLALQPAVGQVVERAEEHEARSALAILLAAGITQSDEALARKLTVAAAPGVTIRWGNAEQLGVPPEFLESLSSAGQSTPSFQGPDGRTAVVALLGGGGLISASVRQDSSRSAVARVYILMTVALLAVYALVAAALEIFVLPRHVYEPIRAILAADHAVAEGSRDAELVPDDAIPSDELGEIMQSRNRSIRALRRHEADLAQALQRIEEVASDLKRKNHLLETARQNLADADRLASLGMMSAGLAHELNTPLAVIKGLAEKLNTDPSAGATRRSLSAVESALLLRVVGRLERLSESLLDFARARPPASRSTTLRPLVDEAATLVRLDRDAAAVEIINEVPDGLTAWCDGDRMVQVFVNLLRNAVDAMGSRRFKAAAISAPPHTLGIVGTGSSGAAAAGRAGGVAAVGGAAGGGANGTNTPDAQASRPPAQIRVAAELSTRDGRRWATITVSDNGPGIDSDVFPRLFQPFATTRLDARGTGLGLATSEGIVREHGGVLLARNSINAEGRVAGAVFEIVLPAESA